MVIDIAWDSRFEVGNERIDLEHRIFVGLIRDLSLAADAASASARGSQFERVLREIVKYAEFHFVSEENTMADLGYPLLPQHRQLHEMLVAELTNKIHAWRSGREEPGAIVDFLFQWFALHTTQEDKRLAEFIAARA